MTAVRKLAAKRRWREEDARRVVRAWRDSDASLAEFAERLGCRYERLRRWVRRLDGWEERDEVRGDEGGLPLAFVEVRAPASDEAPLEVLVGGVIVRVRRGFDGAALRAVVDVLAGPSC